MLNDKQRESLKNDVERAKEYFEQINLQANTVYANGITQNMAQHVYNVLNAFEHFLDTKQI